MLYRLHSASAPSEWWLVVMLTPFLNLISHLVINIRSSLSWDPRKSSDMSYYWCNNTLLEACAWLVTASRIIRLRQWSNLMIAIIICSCWGHSFGVHLRICLEHQQHIRSKATSGILIQAFPRLCTWVCREWPGVLQHNVCKRRKRLWSTSVRW